MIAKGNIRGGALLLMGCAARQAPFQGLATERGEVASAERVRLVFIGDSGAPADGEDSHIDAATLQALRRSVRAEQADGIFALGDLVYGVGGPLELSPRCHTPRGRADELLDARLGGYYADLGAPTWLVLGNHDVGHYTYSRQRARCLMAYAETQPHLSLPAAMYTVDYGAQVRVVVVDTNVPPDRWDTAAIRDALPAEDSGTWTLMVGHHVLRTAFDKEDEQQKDSHDYRGWLRENQVQPDLWLNGHAHFLQFGVYDDIPAVTSGSGSKIRERPTCPGTDCVGEDMPLFSRSLYGYAVVDITPERLDLRFKDAQGEALWCWVRTPTQLRGASYDCAEEAATPSP